MATQADVRRIALALPETTEASDRFAFSVDGKGLRVVLMEAWRCRAPRRLQLEHGRTDVVKGKR